MMSHETNNFSNIPTDRGQFEARNLHYGGEIIEAYRGTGTCLGGMIDEATRRGATLIPSVAAAASPAGFVTKDIYGHVKERMLRDLKAAGAVDGVLLDLHGDMVPEGLDDGEGDLIQAVRRVVGPGVPIAVTLDFHGNLSETMVREADLLHGYKTYPHVTWASGVWRRPNASLMSSAGASGPPPPCASRRSCPPSAIRAPAADPCGGSTTWRTRWKRIRP